jgi:hypothetical protein
LAYLCGIAGNGEHPLGWESLSVGEEFARFQTGGATLALFSLGLLALPRTLDF